MNNLLNELKRLDEQAHPPKWEWDIDCLRANNGDNHDAILVFDLDWIDMGATMGGADIQLIVYLRNNLPSIINLLEAGEKLREAANETLSDSCSCSADYTDRGMIDPHCEWHEQYNLRIAIDNFDYALSQYDNTIRELE